jgi:hypothetical protein
MHGYPQNVSLGSKLQRFRGFVLGYVIFFCNFFGSFEMLTVANTRSIHLGKPRGEHSALSHS